MQDSNPGPLFHEATQPTSRQIPLIVLKLKAWLQDFSSPILSTFELSPTELGPTSPGASNTSPEYRNSCPDCAQEFQVRIPSFVNMQEIETPYHSKALDHLIQTVDIKPQH